MYVFTCVHGLPPGCANECMYSYLLGLALSLVIARTKYFFVHVLGSSEDDKNDKNSATKSLLFV